MSRVRPTNRSSSTKCGATGGRHRRDVHSTAQIPVLRAYDKNSSTLFNRFQDILASASKVTIVCGAGISTHAGIPVRVICLNVADR